MKENGNGKANNKSASSIPDPGLNTKPSHVDEADLEEGLTLLDHMGEGASDERDTPSSSKPSRSLSISESSAGSSSSGDDSVVELELQDIGSAQKEAV